MASTTVYEMVTKRIIEIMEEGRIPWHKPWTGTLDGAFNRVSKRPYSLLNQMMLKHSGEYASFKQWKELGGHIKKGAKSEFVVFWKMNPIVKDVDGEAKVSQVPILRYYNVFHISDVEGVEPLENEIVKNSYPEPIPAIDSALRDYAEREGIDLCIRKSNEAFYSPTFDQIVVPLLEQFDAAEEFYSTWAHESIHSTMKASRCDREHGSRVAAMGRENYSKEELVAEIGAANILNHFGVDTEKTIRNSAAYIQSWLRALRNDPKMIVSASGKAERATNYILGEKER